jgi:3D (Asp-Asp-Asp) domain-containing protein
MIMSKNKYIEFYILTFLSFAILFTSLAKTYSFFGLEKDNKDQDSDNISGVIVFQGNTLSSLANPANPPLKVIRKLPVVVTAYSSTPEQTDDTPNITANGTLVRDGIVANNLLSFGTEIRMPEIYGEKIFTVEDRMHSRKGDYHFDVWFQEYSDALGFGAQLTYVEVLGR